MSRYLALDWDQQLLHVVSGAISGTTCTIQKAGVWQEANSPNLAEASDQGHVLKARLREAGIAPAPVLAIVPRDTVILKDLRIPAVPPHEEPPIVRFQTIKELSHREEDIVLDYTVMHGPSTASLGSDRRVLAVVLRKEMVTTYQELCASAGLRLAGITPRPFALSVGLQRLAGTAAQASATGGARPMTENLPLPGGASADSITSADNAVALVMITGRWGEFSVFRGDIPVLTRTINIGGNLAAELRRNLAVYSGQSPQHPVRAVYLCGAISDDVRAALAAALPDLPLHPLDPFAHAGKAQVPLEQRAGFLPAVGILYARARKAGLPINFLEPRQPRKPADPNLWLGYAAAAGVLALLGAGAVYGYIERTAAADRLTQVQEQQQQITSMLNLEKEKGKKLQALDAWENTNEMAELRELRQKIADVDKLRIIRVRTDPVRQEFRATPSSVAGSSPTTAASGPVYVIDMTIYGELLTEGREELDKFVKAISDDPLYSVKAPIPAGKNFTLNVKIQKRSLKAS